VAAVVGVSCTAGNNFQRRRKLLLAAMMTPCGDAAHFLFCKASYPSEAGVPLEKGSE